MKKQKAKKLNTTCTLSLTCQVRRSTRATKKAKATPKTTIKTISKTKPSPKQKKVTTAPIFDAPRSNDPPTFIFEHVGYTEKGKALQLASGTVRTLAIKKNANNTPKENATLYVEKRYEIPSDFERPIRFGPVSGSNYSSRVIQGYIHDQLERKSNAPKDKQVANVQALTDQGFEENICIKLLLACENNVDDALELLYEN